MDVDLPADMMRRSVGRSVYAAGLSRRDCRLAKVVFCSASPSHPTEEKRREEESSNELRKQAKNTDRSAIAHALHLSTRGFASFRDVSPWVGVPACTLRTNWP